MKKHYEKLCVVSLGFQPVGSLLQASYPDPAVQSTGQEVETYDFSDDSFNQSWGES